MAALSTYLWVSLTRWLFPLEFVTSGWTAPQAAESFEVIISYVYKISMQLAVVLLVLLYSLARIIYYSSMCPLKSPFDTLYVFFYMELDAVPWSALQWKNEQDTRKCSSSVKAECVLSWGKLYCVICLRVAFCIVAFFKDIVPLWSLLRVLFSFLI